MEKINGASHANPQQQSVHAILYQCMRSSAPTLSQTQMSEQAFWLSDLTHNMADLSEQYMARDGKWKLLFHLNSSSGVENACFTCVGGKRCEAAWFWVRRVEDIQKVGIWFTVPHTHCYMWLWSISQKLFFSKRAAVQALCSRSLGWHIDSQMNVCQQTVVKLKAQVRKTIQFWVFRD